MYEFDITKPHCFYFNEISKIPHGSFNEKEISDYLVKFAKDRNLDYIQDENLNVIIFKKASVGYENSKPILLQGHMDMVCEKNKSSNHDFLKDSLKLRVIDDEWLEAEGTTLGADDGVAIAYMLTILDDNKLPHPDLECCFTVEEETGLTGALKLDTSVFKARRMVSLDGSGEVITCTSSSGGCDVLSNIKVNYVENIKPTYRLFVSGLSGGHSGGEIQNEKGNSIKTAFRILKQLQNKGIKLNISSVEGGLKRNAIPRECEVILTTDDKIEELVSSMYLEIKKELEFSEPNFKVDISKIEAASKVMDDESSEKLINYVFLSINGFRHKSMGFEGLTLASLNLGTIKTEEDKVVVAMLLRSSMSTHVDHMIDVIECLASLFNIEVIKKNRYPGWNYKADSELRNVLNDVLKEELDKELTAVATHGGLECGVFADIDESMDIITYGPIMLDIHTPDERLNLPSFDRSYKVLTKLIEKCI